MTTKKQASLTKKLIKEVIIFVLIVVFLGGSALYVFNYVQGQEKRENDAQNSIRQIESQINSIKANYDKANVSIDLYREVSERFVNKTLETDDEALRTILLRLRDKYRLSQLNLKLDPKKPFQIDSVITNNSVVDLNYSRVELKLGAMSDVHLYSFVASLNQELPGIVRITELSVQREKALTNDALFRISKGAVPQIVAANLVFYWLDLREKV